jgi:hypothetical protein
MPTVTPNHMGISTSVFDSRIARQRNRTVAECRRTWHAGWQMPVCRHAVTGLRAADRQPDGRRGQWRACADRRANWGQVHWRPFATMAGQRAGKLAVAVTCNGRELANVIWVIDDCAIAITLPTMTRRSMAPVTGRKFRGGSNRVVQRPCLPVDPARL